MSGLDYDNLGKHKRARELGEVEQWEQMGEAKTETEFFQVLTNQEWVRGRARILLDCFSVPAEYAKLYQDTVYKEFLNRAPEKSLQLKHVIAFSSTLRTYQVKFFGEEGESELRMRLVAAAHELRVLDSPMSNDFYTSLDNYALLLGAVDDEKLEFYIQRVLRAKELNSNFVSPVSRGLVAVLQQLSLPSAKIFTSEAFELLAADGLCTPGLQDASSYMLLGTKQSLNRFVELATESQKGE